MPFTKHNYLITDPLDIPRAIAEAFYIASSGRPGPVLVDIINAGEIDLVINTPVGRGTRADGWAIRTAAVQRSIPCITTTAGFSAAVDAITFLQSSPLSIKSLQEWLS